MKIAVIGANGKVGSLLVKEATGRGHEVTAVVRTPPAAAMPTVKVVQKDLFDLTYDDLKDNEVIIDTFGAWTADTLVQHQTSLQYLCDLLSGKPNRLLVVGGAGSLYVNSEHTLQVKDTPDFPDAFKPLATNMGKALDELRKRGDVQWTYVSSAGDFQAEGPRSGKYIASGEELTLNSNKESVISYADYAIAMVDEAENAKHAGKRFSVVADY
ncbi:MAG: NAD(P)-dependent oxidoreductase [Oscillospiraceae bacterium]